MIISQTISHEADMAANRYGMLVEAWRGAYGRALDQSHFGSPRQMNQVISAAYQVAGHFLDNERQIIADTTIKIALEAQATTLEQIDAEIPIGVPADVSEHLAASDAYLEREITIQVERDVAFLQQSIRKTALNVALSARAQQIEPSVALMQYRIGNASELSFSFHDRRNNKWLSAKFIRTVFRQHLLAVYNETVLMTLVDHGIDTALVEHADKKAPPHGMEISVNSDSDMPNYSEVRETIFHPNSDAFLTGALS